MESLLPPNATQLERDIEAVIAARFNALDTDYRKLWNPDDCPVDFLPWLAWAFSVDVWDPDWPEHTKREAIKASYGIHQRKGTVGAVIDAVAALGGSTLLTQWWEKSPQGSPHTFELLINYGGQEITSEFQDRIIEAVERTKRLTQDYTVQTGINGFARVNVLGYVRTATFQRFNATDKAPPP